MTDVATFGGWLRAQREARGLTRRQLAACAGCSAATIRKIEDGERRPSHQVAGLLAGCMGIDATNQITVIQVARGERSADWLPALLPQSIALPAHSPIPSSPIDLIDRDAELDRIANLLQDPACRLITIVGAGGIGKTHLAFEVAQRAANYFRSGALVAELAPVESADLLPSALVHLLHLPTASGDPKAALLDFLSDKQCLLLLDNFEHLLDATRLVEAILAAAPEVKVLITSRERLNVRQEWLLPLEGLPYAALDQLADVEDYGAVKLFYQRARRIDPDFNLSVHAAAVMKICRLVEGLPLAIELAASCLHVMTAAQIADQLARCLDVLSSTARDVPNRHRSMRAALDVSWNLLSESERTALMGVSVFPGSFDLDAAQAIAGASVRGMGALIEKSVARLRRDSRYDLHPLIRRYAAEQMDRADAISLGERHLDFFLRLAEAAAPRMDTAEEAHWLDRLEHERDNLHAGLIRARNIGDFEALARLGSALRHFWAVRGSLIEGYAWLKLAVSHREHLNTKTRADVLFTAGTVAWSQRDQQQAEDWLTESVSLAQQIGDARGMAWALRSLATLMYSKGIYEKAWEYSQQGLALARSSDPQPAVLANLLNLIGLIALARSDFDQARAHFEESLDLYRTLGVPSRIVLALRNLGRLAIRQAHYPEARVALEEGISVARQINDATGVASLLALLAIATLDEGPVDEALTLATESLAIAEASQDEVFVAQASAALGLIWLEQGNLDAARAHLSRSLVYYVQVGQKPDALPVLGTLAQIAAAEGSSDKAVQLFAAVERLRSEINLTFAIRDQALIEAGVASLRQTLAPQWFTLLWAEGSAMTLEQASADAVQQAPQPVLRQRVSQTN